MISEVIRFNTGLDITFNNEIIKRLYSSDNWTICSEENESLDKDYSDTGMLIPSYSDFQPENNNSSNIGLNSIARLIGNISLQKQTSHRFTNVNYRRFLWNYYNKSSSGKFHEDSSNKNTASLIYYINTCDAYTIVNDIKYENIAGTGIIFDSNTLHRGTGPIKSNKKFSLNIIFTYDMVYKL